jgi:8-oxo-dGTP pyrophosphatase MutT (NUDIX family)
MVSGPSQESSKTRERPPHELAKTLPPMHRRSLISLLEAYTPSDATDAAARERILGFVRAHDDCFERTLLEGHVTGSAWIVNPARTRCLLTHHRKLDRWLQLGGHADGQTDALEVAMREAREESGLTSLRPVSEAIFDCDVHPIPGRKTEPEHFHYDVRFLLEADDAEPLVISEESNELAWVSLEDVRTLESDESVMRMVAKTTSARS